MADGTDYNPKNNPLYDVPKKPEVTPRRKLQSTGESTDSEMPLKPLVPPKRRTTVSSGSSVNATPSDTSATPSVSSTAPSTTTTPSVSVANARQKFEQALKDSGQPQKEPPKVAPKSSTPVKSTPPPVKSAPPSVKSAPPSVKSAPPPIPTKSLAQQQSKPVPSIPQSPRSGGQIPVSSRYVEVGSSNNDIPEAPDYADPDALIPRASTSSYPEPGNTDYSELVDNAASSKLVIKSKPFGLEEFATEFPLPQIVRVYAGHYGITEQFSMSEGEELILFFIKSSKIVMASTQRKAETYHLPLNSSLQFGPYTPKSSETEAHSYRYETVEDLLAREEGLPKVVKVFKTFSGPSEEQSVMSGDLIFPQKVSGKKKNRVLKCKTKRGTKLKLGLNCTGDFSTDPSDVRMYLLEYIEHVNDFPVKVLIFNEKDDNSKLCSLRTGTVLILEAPAPLRSYICSTDIFGERDYPIIELPMIMPIQVQSMERVGLDMQPIYSKIQHAYENFDLSMVKKSMFPAQTEKSLKLQQEFYEEVRRDDGSSHLYDLERPEAIYEPIPGCAPNVGIKKEVKPPPRPGPPPSKPLSPQRPAPIPPSIKSPPLPPLNQLPPKPTEEKSFPPPLPSRPVNPVITPPIPPANPSKAIPATPPHIQPQIKLPPFQKEEKPTTTKVLTVQPKTVTENPTPEENLAVLKVMTGEDILLLLDNMNLGEYKDSFQQEQVDGELMLELSKSDLEDLGVTKNIHQIRLLKLIDGSSSVKKYADGLYGTLS